MKPTSRKTSIKPKKKAPPQPQFKSGKVRQWVEIENAKIPEGKMKVTDAFPLHFDLNKEQKAEELRQLKIYLVEILAAPSFAQAAKERQFTVTIKPIQAASDRALSRAQPPKKPEASKTALSRTQKPSDNEETQKNDPSKKTPRRDLYRSKESGASPSTQKKSGR